MIFKTRVPCLVLLMALVFCVPGAHAIPRDVEATSEFMLAEKLLNQGDNAGAIEHAVKARALLKKSSWRIEAILVQASLRAGDDKKALEALDAFFTVAPAAESGDEQYRELYSEMIELYAEVKQRVSEKEQAVALEKKRKQEEAEREKRKKDELVALVTEYCNKARTSYDDKNYKAAAEDYTKCFNENGENNIAGFSDEYLSIAYKAKGISNYFSGNYETAIDDFSKSIQADDKNPYVYSSRGYSYNKIMQYSLAIEDFDTAIKLKPDYSHYYLGRCIANQGIGKTENAISDCTKVVELKPDNIKAYEYLGISYAIKGRYDLCVQDYTKAIELQPDSGDYYNYRAISYLGAGNYDSAISDISRSIELSPDKSNHYSLRGNIYLLNGNYEKALADYTKAIELSPTNEYYKLNHLLAASKLSSSERRKSQKLLKEYIKTVESDSVIKLICLCFLDMDGIDEEDVLEKINQQTKASDINNNLEAYYYLAWYRFLDGDKDEALDHLNKVIEFKKYSHVFHIYAVNMMNMISTN